MHLYDLALAYDIAFDFRDLKVECDILDSISVAHRASTPRVFLDLACGPGYHCLEYAARGVRSYGLDLSPSMLCYATQKAERHGVRVKFLEADMREFTSPEPADLAFCAMSSFHHLLTNNDIAQHLDSVADNLTADGVYVIEADHPRDVFGLAQSLQHDWISERDGIVVRSSWGQATDPFDPITQITSLTVRVEIARSTSDETENYQFATQLRRLTFQEFVLLVERSRRFEIVDVLGCLDTSVPFSNDANACRLVAVLKKLR